jgi:iron complex outermembrane recepter protein
MHILESYGRVTKNSRCRLKKIRPAWYVAGLIGSAICFSTSGAFAQDTAAAQADQGIETITVTSERTSENIQQVPLSVSAFTETTMEDNGIEQFADVMRMTPGLVISQPNLQSGNTISIRGIASTAGQATTGVYIDDTPIQAAALGTGGYGQIYPVIFDLDRIEVLRGPQGTLFGSGSEGGTVRFIQPEASLDTWSTRARAEVNSVGQDGAIGYEYGLAVGGPIINDTLGFRLDGFYQKEAGWINEEQGQFNILDATGNSGAASAKFQPTGLVYQDANWRTNTALRATFTWAPFENLKIMPSVQYQDSFQNYQGGTFSVSASQPTSDHYVNLMAVATIDATHVATPDPQNEPADDQFILPTLKAVWDVSDNWSVVNDSSLMVRKQYGWEEYPSYEATYARRPTVQPGDKADADRSDNYDNVTEEIRVAYANPTSWITGTAGLFYSKFRQEANQYSISNYFHGLCSTGSSAVVSGVTYPGGVCNGAPFGAGYNAFTNYFGLDLPTFNAATSPTPVPGAAAGSYPYTVSYYSHIVTHQEQEAAFAQVDIKPWEGLDITAGVRGALISSDIYSEYGGATSNLNAPHGLPCVPGTGGPGEAACTPVATGAYTPGTGPFAISFPGGPGAPTYERSFTPKLGVQYQINEEDMIYGSATKGFRPGGAQPELNSTCDFQLISLGFTKPNPSGTGVVADSPTSYGSDSVWSYEIGSKDSFLDDRLVVDGSAYLITWRNIQTSVSVSSCLQSIIANTGGAEGHGVDLSAQYKVLDNLTLGLSGGWSVTSFTGNVILGGNKIYSDGSGIPNSGPPVRLDLMGRYDFKLDQLPFYFQGDFGYQSSTRVSGSTDPLAYNYDPNLTVDPAYTQTNIRIGLITGPADVSFFINNLTDEAPMLGYTHVAIGNPVYTAYTIQPRTIGLTLRYQD